MREPLLFLALSFRVLELFIKTSPFLQRSYHLLAFGEIGGPVNARMLHLGLFRGRKVLLNLLGSFFLELCSGEGRGFVFLGRTPAAPLGWFEILFQLLLPTFGTPVHIKCKNMPKPEVICFFFEANTNEDGHLRR